MSKTLKKIKKWSKKYYKHIAVFAAVCLVFAAVRYFPREKILSRYSFSKSFFAGNGENKNDGDGGLAFNAAIAAPSALAADKDDNIFVYTGNIVRKINTRGIITTVTDAPPNMHCRAVDKDGNLYFAQDNQILKTSDGKTTVIAGTGRAGYFGDGLPADMAELNAPSCVALGPGNTVYIADAGNNAVRRITFNR